MLEQGNRFGFSRRRGRMEIKSGGGITTKTDCDEKETLALSADGLCPSA